MKQLTFSESELVEYIRKNLSGRYTELQVTHNKKTGHNTIALWYIDDVRYDCILYQELPAAVFIDAEGNLYFKTLNKERKSA